MTAPWFSRFLRRAAELAESRAAAAVPAQSRTVAVVGLTPRQLGRDVRFGEIGLDRRPGHDLTLWRLPEN
jgi:hypothetical protein